MSINRVTLSGNLTRDPEVRMAGSTPVCEFGLAVNDRKKNQQTGEYEDVPNYFDVVVWGARGEALAKHLSKGSKIMLDGRLRWRQWQTQDGQNRSKVEIVAEDVEFAGQKPASTSQANTSPATTAEVFGDDIPF